MLQGIERIASGKAVFTPQDHSRATVTRMFEKQDGRIRWGAAAREIHNLVRASIPWPVAHCLFHGDVCRIHNTQVEERATDAVPGTITRVEPDRVLTATGQGLLAVLEIQMPGKRVMSIAEFLRGHSIERGERFEDIP
jgi:methionyl-tRNA formyltransferase